MAQDTPAETPAPPPPNADPTKLLLGDAGGLRSELVKRGIIPAVTDIEETLGNVSGGIRQGLIFEGLTDFSLAYDFRPRFQYIVNPGGGIPNPLMPPSRIKNTLIGGVRTTINC